MICKYCGNEIEQGKYCPACGNKLEQEKVEIEEINPDGSSNNTQNIESDKKPLKKKRKWLYIIIAFVLISIFTKGKVSDGDYISCAQTLIRQDLKCLATAEFSDGKVVEKDKYGRALVTVTVDAQNGFGAYIRNRYAVVIDSYDKKTGEFTYNRNAIIDLDNSELTDIGMEFLKISSNWDKPIESN
jgi:hypothetical protein